MNARQSEETRRFRLTLGYDGRPFEGWQSQVGGNTVQDRLLAALRGICPSIATVQGSGRTDAGVGALGQVAHFDAPASASLDGAAWVRALNAKLPATIRVFDCRETDPAFHARFDAAGKTYRYTLWTGPVLPPLRAGLAWRVAPPKDETAFAAVLRTFEGEHDFTAFSANRGDGRDADRDAVRRIESIVTRRDGDALEIEVSGDGFLYKMVRFLVGTAVEAGRGRLPVSEAVRLLDEPRPGEKAPFCAPPDGLLLVNVRYPA